MKPTISSLKLSAIAFTVLWSGWMLWWGGTYELANLVILSVSGAVAGYFWYRAMRWSFRRMNLLPRDGVDAGTGKSS